MLSESREEIPKDKEREKKTKVKTNRTVLKISNTQHGEINNRQQFSLGAATNSKADKIQKFANKIEMVGIKVEKHFTDCLSKPTIEK